MSSPTVTSPSARRRTFGSEQEPGLAEWTSKIRQLQQEVDEDVEAEQKRLAQEIAKSRMERTKRRGTGTYVLSPETAQEFASDSDDMRQIVDKQQSQSEAFRKLVGGGDAGSRTTPPPSDRPAPISLAQFMGGRATGPRLNKHTAQQDAVDYAAFEQPRGGSHPVFGSRALSPTSSDGFSVSQRANQRAGSGVALPGLATSRSATPAASSRPYTPESPARVASPPYQPRSSSPLVTRPESASHVSTRPYTPARSPEPAVRVAGQVYEPPLASPHYQPRSNSPLHVSARSYTPARSPEPAVRVASPAVYEPRASTPLATHPFTQTHTPEPNARSHTPELALRAASRNGSRAGTPSASSPTKSPSPRATSPTTPERTDSKSPPPVRPFTPKSPSVPTTPSANQFRSSAVSRPLPSPGTPQRAATSTTPSRATASTTPKSSPQAIQAPSFLARPLPPGSMRPAQQIIPPTNAMSIAFLKPPKEKDLTPSLSRLQGRGFVEQRVKASAKLTDGVFKPASPLGEHGERKRSSLVDMWAKRDEEVKTPPSPSTPKMVGKLATPFAKAQQQAPASPSPARPAPPPAAAKPAVSRPLPTPVAHTPPPAPPAHASARAAIVAPPPSKSPTPVPVAEKSLGSSHTLISFARPPADQTMTAPVRDSGLERQPSGSSPLTHPTKDRPRKRKGASSSTPAPTIRNVPPPTIVEPVTLEPHPAAPAFNDGSSASDFDSVRVRSELINQFPSPPSTTTTFGGPDELGRRQAFREAPPEEKPPPDGDTVSHATQHFDDARAPTVPSVFAAGVEAWADRAPIGVAKKSNGDLGIGMGLPPVLSPGRGRALPGLTGGSPFSSGGSSSSGADDLNVTERQPERTKHPRIPSTGTRATVMDVAQALMERHERESSATSTASTSEPEPELEPERAVTPRPEDPTPEQEEEEAQRVDVRAAAALWEKQSASSDSDTSSLGTPRRQDSNGRTSPHHVLVSAPQPEVVAETQSTAAAPAELPTPVVSAPVPVPVHVAAPAPHTVPIPRARPPVNMERRRSTYEKYSSIILPPVQEEVTPVNSPQASLSRANNNGTSPVPLDAEPEVIIVQDEVPHVHESPAEEEPVIVEEEVAEERVIQLEHEDGLLPAFNLNAIHASATTFRPDESVQTLSVEVFIISGSTSTPARKPEHVFYETETIAVVYRAKAQKTGLVSSKVWAWRGREANAGEREEQKLAELAKRFGTALINCPQGCESLELVHLLGGVLIVRQGPRAHWSAENTAMHRVRSAGNVIFIDQLDLSIVNLCSGYSFCLSILGSLYVWHGRGSLEVERQQAAQYANTMLLSEGMEVVELAEGSEDELFWAVLGDEPYANAEYWQWRLDLAQIAPRLFRIDSSKGKDAVKHIPNFAMREITPDGVFVVDGVFELFVLVGAQARGHRTDIRLALYIAENISMAVARHRPFDPVIHALVMPSLWPLDVKALFRDFDESLLNDGLELEHMNVITYEEAHDHMARQEWLSSELSDLHFLPLGVSPDMLS